MGIIETVTLPLIILALASLHAFAEIIYKKGGMKALSDAGRARSLSFWRRLVTSPIVIVSLIISGVVKLLYGIVLASNPLFVTGGIYLAAVGLFSVIGGRLVFSERISQKQMIGFLFIATGMILMV
ncbi:MAG: hypothetical protein ACTSWA_08215 [Candidatus Thorarchaeota archaeon]